MNNSSTIDLTEMRFHLPEGPHLQSLRADAGFWKRLQSDRTWRAGRMLGVHVVRSDEDVHASQWERHPNGDELICLVSGQVDLVLDESSGERLIQLEPLTGFM